MKSLVQVLILIKEEYNRNPVAGMCYTARSLWRREKITLEERALFTKEWAKTVARKKRFYTHVDDMTTAPEYGWRVGNMTARNSWLTQRIGKYS